MDSYAEYKAGGTETSRIQRLKGNMNQATKGLNTGKRTVAKILDGGKRISSGITDEKRWKTGLDINQLSSQEGLMSLSIHRTLPIG
jgi:hypothetical protein